MGPSAVMPPPHAARLRSCIVQLKREQGCAALPFDVRVGAEAVAILGDVPTALRLLHYALLDFSAEVARLVRASCGKPLTSASDEHFVTLTFRALSDVFGYHPAVSPAIFLSAGRFLVRRATFLSDVIEKVCDIHRRSVPGRQRLPSRCLRVVDAARGGLSSKVPDPPRKGAMPAKHAPDNGAASGDQDLTQVIRELQRQIRALEDRVVLLERRRFEK